MEVSNDFTVVDPEDDDQEEECTFDEQNLLESGLSAETLAALVQFRFEALHTEYGDNGSDTVDEKKISAATMCAVYTAKDMNVIAYTLSRLEMASSEAKAATDIMLKQRVLLELEPSTLDTACARLERDGVVRINDVMPADLCDRCLQAINDSLAAAILHNDPMTPETGFGGVLYRDNR